MPIRALRIAGSASDVSEAGFLKANESVSGQLEMNHSIKAVAASFLAIFLGLLSAFLVFYEVRLLYVTRGLSAIREGGQGAYIGAVVFPLLALLFGFLAWRCFRTAGKR